MSVDFESAARLASLKRGIEAKTGETHATLTDGVNALIAGFGQGGGSGVIDTRDWVRPSNWPDLDSLGVPEVGTIYLTYDCRGTINGEEAGEFCINNTTKPVCHRGYVQNGEFVPIAEVPSGQEPIPTDEGDFVVYRIQAPNYWGFEGNNVYDLYKQPCVEVYGATDGTKGAIQNNSYTGIPQRVKAFTMYGYTGQYSLQSVSNFGMEVEYINADVFVPTIASTNLSWSYGGLHRIKKLKIPFDTSKATNMSSMLRGNLSVEEYDLSAMDTSEATNLSYMFYTNFALKRLDISNFNTSKVNNFASMFQNCHSLYSLDFSGLDTSSASGTIKMFIGCRLLTNLRVGKITTSFTFTDCNSLSHESLLNVIAALEPTDTAMTLTIGTTNLAKLTDAEIAVANEKGWTVV